MQGTPPTPPRPTAASLLGSPVKPTCKEALAEVSSAFGSLLADLQFSFVVSSARSADMPIVFASSSFFTCTGFGPSEVLGRNCRFLQGPGTSHQAVMELRDAIREERGCSVLLLNYRRDKTPFYNYLRLEPVRAACGMVEFYVGVQADVTRLVEAGGGSPLEAQAQQGAAAAAAVAERLAAQQGELARSDSTPKCAVMDCVPSSMLTALSKVQDNFVLSDPNQPDCPIVFASQGFLKMTGYPCSEVVGRNCRFLQGPGTDPAAVAQLREALSAESPRPVTVTLLNFKKSGEPFWNSLHVAPLRDADGKVQFFVGVQLELTDDEEGDGAAAADGANGAAAPQPDPIALLRQKGVVGSLRVATRALAQHGLRRSTEFQHKPCRAD